MLYYSIFNSTSCRKRGWLPTRCTLLLLCLIMAGCQKSSIKQTTGTLALKFEVDASVTSVTSGYTKAAPDPTSFALFIKQGTQTIDKFSPIGSATPPAITLPVGDYTLEVASATFNEPAFDTPVYGTTQEVNIAAGTTRNVTLDCRQTNAGVRITYDAAFQSAHSSYLARIEHSTGALDFSGTDASRTGYFPAGEATLIITADGTRFEQALTLRSCRLYNISVKDAETPVVSGTTNVTITITTDIEQENLTVTFPASGGSSSGGSGTTQTLYCENMGTTHVSSNQIMIIYSGWQNGSSSGISYTGSGKICYAASDISQGYTGASGGNYLLLESGNSITISGLNSLGASQLSFSMGCCRHDLSAFSQSDLSIYASSTGQSSDETALSYTSSTSSGWVTATISSGIPASATLFLRIQCNNNAYRLDDLLLTGIK